MFLSTGFFMLLLLLLHLLSSRFVMMLRTAVFVHSTKPTIVECTNACSTFPTYTWGSYHVYHLFEKVAQVLLHL